MFKNYLTTAFRALTKNKLFSAINIGGLAIGMMATILILLFVRHETSYDKWIPDHQKIYRLHSTFNLPGRDAFRTVRSSGPMAKNLQASFQEIETAARLLTFDSTVLQQGKAFSQTIGLVDPAFFDIFPLPLIAVNQGEILPDFQSVVLTEKMARKYFGNQSPLGQTLTLCCIRGQELEMRVSAVLKDLPENTHLDFEILALINEPAFENLPFMFASWTSVNNNTYLKLKDGASPETIAAGFPAFLDAKVPAEDDTLFERASEFYSLSLMNIADIYLNAADQASDIGDMKPLGNRESVLGFTGIAFLILTIAILNFVNLSTARAANRAREISLRKTLGAGQRNLVVQFIGESILITSLAGGFAIGLVDLALPYFNSFLGKSLEFDLFGNPGTGLGLIGLILLVGALGGLYPALYLASFKPARVLMANQSSDDPHKGKFRNIFVFLQFSISIALITATAVVYQQTSFAKTVDLGFERGQKLVIRGLGGSAVEEKKEAIRNEFREIPGVKAAIFSSDVPTDNWENNNDIRVATDEGLQNFIINLYSVEEGFFEGYGVNPIAGRLFDEKRGTDVIVAPENQGDPVEAGVILNEAAVRQFGFKSPNDALGGTILSDQMETDNIHYTIIGVIPDIRFRSIHYNTRPTMFINSPQRFDNLTILFDTDEVPRLVSRLEKIWATMAPRTPFRYEFLDDMIAQQYVREDERFRMFAGFSILAILISLLGLFGLSHFFAEKRTKEIGIRKVHGASTVQIIRLLLWQFTKPVVWANFVAWPVAWNFLEDWLSTFVVRIDLSILHFLAAGFVAAFIAWLTVANQAWRVARTNPVKSLRYE